MADLKEVTDELDDNVTFTLADAVLDLAPGVVQALNLTLHLKVKTGISSPKGKWADGLGNVIALDYKNITPIVVEAFRTSLVAAQNQGIGRLLLIDPVLDSVQ